MRWLRWPGILDGSEDSAASALKHARATMRRRFPPSAGRQPPPRPGSREERDLVERFTHAYQAGDIAAVVALLTEDISVTMPPLLIEYHGRDLVARFLATTGLRPGRRSRLIAARADKVCAMTGFDTSALPHFGLPRTLPR